MNQDPHNSRLEELDERSDEVRELLGAAPRWIVRWGISVILISLILIIVGSSLISYNDIIPARVTVTTRVPPAYLEAKVSGKLTNIFVVSNQVVKEGDVLAEIENTADFNNVQTLYTRLKQLEIKRSATLDSVFDKFPSGLILGPIQPEYNNFIKQYQSYVLFHRLESNQKELEVLAIQIKEHSSLLSNQQNQLKLFGEELALSLKAYVRSKSLYESKVISEQDFETATKTMLADKQRFESLKVSISNTQIAISNLRSQQTKLGIVQVESIQSHDQLLQEAIQRLKNSILSWEQTYLIKSPIDGAVTLFDVWNKYQNVDAGQILFTVIPEDLNEIIGKLTMPVRNSGKVKVGQKVIIKLDNYPYHEWGSINGRIVNISSVPKQGEASYTIYVDIDSLNTSFNRSLEFRQEMQGSAEIIAEELSILQRIFYQLRKILERKSINN